MHRGLAYLSGRQGPAGAAGAEAGGANNRRKQGVARGPGKSPGGGGWQPLAADFLMDQAHKTERLSLSSGKGHPGLCPASGAALATHTRSLPSLCLIHPSPEILFLLWLKCKKTRPSYRGWKFTEDLTGQRTIGTEGLGPLSTTHHGPLLHRGQSGHWPHAHPQPQHTSSSFPGRSGSGCSIPPS